MSNEFNDFNFDMKGNECKEHHRSNNCDPCCFIWLLFNLLSCVCRCRDNDNKR